MNYGYSTLLRAFMASTVSGERYDLAVALAASSTRLLEAFAGEFLAYTDDTAPTVGRYFTGDLDAALGEVEGFNPTLGAVMADTLDVFASDGDRLEAAVQALAGELRTRLAIRDSVQAEADAMVADHSHDQLVGLAAHLPALPDWPGASGAVQ